MDEHQGICALCGLKKELQLSHIIPKFVGKYLKETSAGNIRNHALSERVVQDIEKHYLLCHDCEEMFSAKERYFSNTLFYPYLRDKKDTFAYDEQLFYFLTSLSWRSLYLDILDFVQQRSLKLDVLEKMIDSDKIMREFLFGERKDLGEIEHHIFFFERIMKVNAPPDSLFKTGCPHATIHRSLTSYSGYADNTIYTISNLMGIVVVSLYAKDQDELWQGTQIQNGPGVIYAKNQHIQSRLGNEFNFWMEQSEAASKCLSDREQEKILKRITDLGEDIKNYPFFQDVMDDRRIED